MAKDGGGNTILIVGALGVAVYGYFQGWFASLAIGTEPYNAYAPAAAASPTTTGTTSTVTTTPTAVATTSAYSGPSLAQMFAALRKAEQAAFGSDSSLTCGGGGAMSGLGILRAPSSIDVTRASGSAPSRGQSTVAAPVTSCANPYATYDGHNWYLTQRANVGVTDGQLAAPDHTTLVSLSDYWAWAAPLLQRQIPGLAGLGNVYAGLNDLARRARGW